LTNCTAWYALARFPAGTGPGEAPPGWGPPASTTPITSVATFGYHCNRISVGPYERGPVSLLLDTHNNAKFPTNCTSDPQGGTGSTSFLVLASVLIDDPDVAAFLATAYGMPTQVAEVSTADQGAGDAVAHQWTWRTGSGAASTITVYDEGAYATAANVYDRFFWPRHGGISVLEIQEQGVGPAGPVFNRAVTGVLQPPMLLAALPGGAYAGDGKWFPSFDGEGKFGFFEDAACIKPGPQP
jgi:hypothetical protein